MKYSKGRQKTGGRTKGTPNKATKEIQERLSFIIDENMDLLMDDFKSLSSLDRVKTLSSYLKYIMPVMKESDVNISTPEGKVDLMDEDVLDSIIGAIKKEEGID